MSHIKPVPSYPSLRLVFSPRFSLGKPSSNPTKMLSRAFMLGVSLAAVVGANVITAPQVLERRAAVDNIVYVTDATKFWCVLPLPPVIFR